MKNIEPAYISFEQAKWLKEKKFHENCNKFYVTPNSKLFGIGSNGYYNVKNTPKKLLTIGEYVALNSKNVFLAPEQWQVVEWLRVEHGIWISVIQSIQGEGFDCIIYGELGKCGINKHPATIIESPQKAYSAAFDYIIKNNLI